MTTTLTALVDALRHFKLLTTAQLKELDSLPPSIADPKALAKELMERRWLTPYQANLLLQGKGQELLLGSYVLLERLGEGGMGQVFKAKNWKLGRIVALKLIRKERLANPDAIKRFHREVRAAAQLNDSNVVLAYDADEVGGTHLLVMEYVEGSDLAGLVKKQGPLPVEQACDFIRQAALGLQHAFEKGLVHRDIKPANLLLTAKGNVVKILDMGLARHDAAGDKSSTMTQEGSVMGTPDYIAPEQAMDSHTVDIRGDIYSLGCTLYFLLTGSAPFPGGTLMEKLLKHRLEEPKPVEQLRSDVPPGVVAVVRKMTAKKPEDRYQTPGDVVAALLAMGSSPVQFQDERTMAEGGMAQRATPLAVGDSGDTVEAVAASRKQLREADQRHWRRLTVAGGVLLLGAVAVFVGLLFWQRSPPQEAKTTAGSPPVVEGPRDTPKKVDEAWLKQIAAMPTEDQVKAVVAKLKELNPDFDGKETHKIEKGVVTEISFSTDNVTDISPVRALTGLKSLICRGSAEGKGRLADLSPLKDMKLTGLNGGFTKVSDLSPLRGMPLTNLICSSTAVDNLSPLKDMKLTNLICGYTKVSDLTPLKGMPLTYLHCGQTKVADLEPLKGMPLTGLQCGNSQVSDLSPLKDMKLAHLNCGGTKVSDLSPVKGMTLTNLICYATQIAVCRRSKA